MALDSGYPKALYSKVEHHQVHKGSNEMKMLRIILVVALLLVIAGYSQATLLSGYRPVATGQLAIEPNLNVLLNARGASIIYVDTIRIPAEGLTGYSSTFQVGFVYDANPDSNKIRLRFDTDMLYLVMEIDTLVIDGTYDGDSVAIDSAWFEAKALSDLTLWEFPSDSNNYFCQSYAVAAASPFYQIWRNARPPYGTATSTTCTQTWGYPLAIRHPGMYRIGVHTNGIYQEGARVTLYLILIPAN